MMKINADFTSDLYRFLPRVVREADQKAGGLLERYLLGPQLVWEGQTDDIFRLDTLHDLDRIEDQWLPYLKWTVGWTSELDEITRDLDVATLRKLIRLSVGLWKLKGTEIAYKDAIRILTGRDVVVRNWFSYRWVVGVTALWQQGRETDPYIVGSEFGDRDEYLSFLFIHNEVDIDRGLIRKIVNLGRPLQEVVRIVYGLLVDDFRLGRQKWVTDVAPDVAWDSDRFRLDLASGTVIRANVAALTDTAEVIWRHRAVFGAASGGAVQLEFYRDASAPHDTYRATWEQDGSVQLEIVKSGIPAVLDFGSNSTPFPQDEPAVLGVNVFPEGAGLRLRVLVYSQVIIDYSATGPEVLNPGQWRISNSSTGAVHIDDVVVLAPPVIIDEVSGSGEIDGGA
jgi:phage tail-like protein